MRNFSKLAVIYREISALVVAKRNPRTHSVAQIEQIAGSITAFGWTNPVLIDEDARIIAGHGRLEAARKLGMAEVPTITLAGLDDAQKRALVIADNQLALNAGWDSELLALELGELGAAGFDVSLIGFSDDEMAAILADRTEGLTDPDDVPEAPAEPASVLGDVWTLGRHRLVCGDCTDAGVVEDVMGGKLANYAFTSPPYGIDLEYEKGDSLETLITLIRGAIGSIHLATTGDAYATMNYADIYRPGAPGFTPMSEHYHRPFVDHAWALRGNRIWFKPFGRLALSYGTSTTMNLREWEYVQTWRKGRGKEKLREHGMTLRGVWPSFGDQAVIKDWKQHDITTDKEIHPAAFPVMLPVAGLRCYTDENAVIFDPFVGSGTTIIAAEMTGRACHAIEISPAYVDVAVLRWQAFAGGTAVHATTGATFADTAAQRALVPA